MMEVDTIAELTTILLGGLGIIWHQQRTVEKLRADFNLANKELRNDLNRSQGELRAEVVANGQRLARIEGFLGIGIPTSAAEGAAGAKAFGDQAQAVGSTASA